MYTLNQNGTIIKSTTEEVNVQQLIERINMLKEQMQPFIDQLTQIATDIPTLAQTVSVVPEVSTALTPIPVAIDPINPAPLV